MKTTILFSLLLLYSLFHYSASVVSNRNNNKSETTKSGTEFNDHETELYSPLFSKFQNIFHQNKERMMKENNIFISESNIRVCCEQDTDCIDGCFCSFAGTCAECFTNENGECAECLEDEDCNENDDVADHFCSDSGKCAPYRPQSDEQCRST